MTFGKYSYVPKMHLSWERENHLLYVISRKFMRKKLAKNFVQMERKYYARNQRIKSNFRSAG